MVHPVLVTSPAPPLDDLALDAICHLGAALAVLELHAQHQDTPINCVCRDLLRIYLAKADQAQAEATEGEALLGVLYEMSMHLGHAIEVLDHLNGDEADDPILYAVSYLLKAAKRLADEGVCTASPDDACI